MPVVTVGLVTGGFALLLALMLIAQRVNKYRISSASQSHEDGGFSAARYEPMARLLDDDDFDFLAAQPGYKPQIGAKLRRQRRRIFRLYLRELAEDFRRLHAEAREIVADSPEPNAQLVGVLMRQQVTFWVALFWIEARLSAEWLGLGRVDVRGLLDAVEAMRVDLARITVPAS